MTAYDGTTALVVVDLQNDFADPSGSLYVKGGEEVIPIINEEIGRAREAGAPVVFTQDWHPAVTPHFEKDGGIWPVHCVAGTWGAELHPDVSHDAGETRIQKGVTGEDGYSGFNVQNTETKEVTSTGLERLLKDSGVEKVVVVGLATDYCVKATALDAASLGFETRVLSNATRAVNLQPDDGQKAIDEMKIAGVSIAG
jgi:nicotinamidase/pyrazinamidase